MQETTRLLRDLVSLPSINPMGRPLEGPQIYEHRVTDYLEQFFRDLNVPFQRQSVAPLRDNIIATYEPPGATWTLILEVHQDTVPVDNMTLDPFGAHVEGGRLYGRGACDVKGSMAAMLAAFARLVREKPGGSARVVLACTVDEEFTFLGVQRLARTDLKGGLTGPVVAVVAEPTNLDIVDAHKGGVRWIVSTRGQSCHSSRPELGENAVYHMARLLPLIETYAEDLRRSANHPRLGSPTLSVGRIEGGTSVNTVPDFCRIEIDRRLLPEEDPAVELSRLDQHLRQATGGCVPFETSEPKLIYPALAPEGSEELTRKLGEAIDSVRGRHEVLAVAYGTDASTLSMAGIPAVVFGPGSIEQAHTRDEWVPLDEVEQAAEILYRLASRK
jgi:acetylornithine deacetylase/succinyl-diaminopimelate desuccinylase-like protein